MRVPFEKILLCIIIVSQISCFGSYDDRIKIDGSSTLYPLTEAVAEEFRSVYPEIKITVGVSGTGGGLKKFVRNEIDIADASRVLTTSEIEQCKKNNVPFIEIPVSNDALVIAVNKSNNFVDYLTVNELKMIWEPGAQLKIKYWDQIRSEWPHLPIQLFGAGTSSGSFDFFTKSIMGEKNASRGDYTASEDDNMLVQGVEGAKGALGYFGLIYYLENKDNLKAIPIDDERDDNGKGAIYPDENSIKNGYYQPLSRTEFLYVNKNSANREIVKKFVDYYIVSASKLVDEIGGVPLQKDTYIEALKRFDNGIEGSIFKEGELLNGKQLHERLKKKNAKNI
jgi:phosphate transport system substrate-binding protein